MISGLQWADCSALCARHGCLAGVSARKRRASRRLYIIFFFSVFFKKRTKKKKAQRQREHRAAATETDEVKKKKKRKRGRRVLRVVVREVLGVPENGLVWVLARGRGILGEARRKEGEKGV